MEFQAEHLGHARHVVVFSQAIRVRDLLMIAEACAPPDVIPSAHRGVRAVGMGSVLTLERGQGRGGDGQNAS